MARAWLAERGYDYDRLFSTANDGSARYACMVIWLQDEVGQDISGMSDEDMTAEIDRLNREDGVAAPIIGKATLLDGRTGVRVRPTHHSGLHLHDEVDSLG